MEVYARSLMRELLRFRDPGLRWFLYLPPGGDLGVELPAEVAVRRRPDVNTLVKTPWLVWQTHRDRLDVFYTPGHRVPAACRGRRVITIYDTAFDRFPECYPSGDAARAHAQVAAGLHSAAAVAVPSEATRLELERGYAYPGERIFVLEAAPRPGWKPDPAAKIPAALADRGLQQPFLLAVGRADPRKNLERVIEAYRRLLAEGVGLEALAVVGPEDFGSAPLRACLDAGALTGERILVTGYLPEEDLLALYRSAAAFVYPSLAEGYGLPVVEAMAVGCPVVTSNCSSLPEAAGGAALLVDPLSVDEIAAALRRILTEPETADALRAAGLRRTARLSWRDAAWRLLPALCRAGAAGDRTR